MTMSRRLRHLFTVALSIVIGFGASVIAPADATDGTYTQYAYCTTSYGYQFRLEVTWIDVGATGKPWSITVRRMAGQGIRWNAWYGTDATGQVWWGSNIGESQFDSRTFSQPVPGPAQYVHIPVVRAWMTIPSRPNEACIAWVQLTDQ